ncbi:integrase catalytic domain-containing protein [Trichonephila clavipes]|nr:integrase catalytic domain-containing protein [Trichonephila clavipes]
MYKNALKEDLIRVVENLDGTVESTDTIVKLKTKIENSSTFESDPDFVKTLIQNCIDERVSRNEREATLGKQKIELMKLQLLQLEKEVELQRVKNKALSLNPAAKVEEKNSETYIQFAARLTANFQYYCSLRKVNSFESLCDLIISDKLFETLNKETATHIGIREAEDWFRPIDLAKECDIYISSRSGSRKEIPITYGYTQDPFKNRSQNFKPKIKENYPQYHERENKNCYICGDSSHYARDCAHAYAYSSAISFPNVSVSNVIENSSYDLSHVKNFNTRNDSSSLIKDYKCNKIKITKLKLSIVREKCSDIVLCKKANGAMKTSSVEFISRSPNPLPMKSEYRRFVLLRKIFQPWQWKRRKKRNRFEQTSRTLQRKISMRSTKDQLVEKDVLMPVKNNVFLWNLPDVEEVPSHDGETV